MTPADAQEIFAEQLRGLRDGGIDLVLVETMSDLGEVEAARRRRPRGGARAAGASRRCRFDTNLRTMMGVRPGDAVTALAAAGVDAVGANCGRGPEEMEPIAAQLAEARPEGLLLVAQSNAGLPQVVGDHFEYDKTPADMAEHARALHTLGIDLVGGLLRLDAGAHRRDPRRRQLTGRRASTARAVSSAARSALMTAPARVPAAAEAPTCALRSVTLPAA